VGADGTATATVTTLPAEILTVEVGLTSSHFSANPVTAVITPPAAAAGAVILQGPDSAKVGDLFIVDVWFQGVNEVKSALISVSYNPARLQATRIIPGTIVQDVTARSLRDNNAGRVDYWTASTGAAFSGDAIYYQIEFKALAQGAVTLQVITPDPKAALWGTSGNMSPTLGSATLSVLP